VSNITTTELTITMRKLREWQACDDGRQWFESKFPQGAAYSAVQQALRADNRFDDSRWLTDHVFSSLLSDPAGVTSAAADDAKAEIAALAELTNPEKVQADTPADVGTADEAGDSAQIGSSGYSARIGSSGYYAQIGSSGYYAQIGSSGDSAQIGSSGYYAQIGSSGYSARIGSSGYSARIGSSGYYAQIGSSGDSAQIGSSGYYAQIGSSGYSARINATGRNAAVACVGQDSRARAGEGGFIALAWHDEEADRPRITVGYVGETIKADTWYAVGSDGVLVEVEGPDSDE
jgi:hypothetical protein